MKDFYKIVKAMLLYMDTAEKPWHTFHLVAIALTVGATALALYIIKKDVTRGAHLVYVFTSAVMIIGEVYKQFCLTFCNPVPFYDWYYFPFQFCSTPLITFTLCAILKKGKLFDVLSIYNGTYCLFAAIIVFVVPSSVFTKSAGLNVQSMAHHAMMIIGGASSLVYSANKITLKAFFGAVGIFTLMMIAAEILNFVVSVISDDNTINYFFISKAYGPVFIQPFKDAYSHPFLVAMYYVVFTEIAGFMAHSAYMIGKRRRRI
ncbi:MAG TPA: hypothetical protein DDW54_01380 [Clostridiales bacterium]|nr:hypothetical protein [Clostridiales bacterium]